MSDEWRDRYLKMDVLHLRVKLSNVTSFRVMPSRSIISPFFIKGEPGTLDQIMIFQVHAVQADKRLLMH